MKIIPLLLLCFNLSAQKVVEVYPENDSMPLSGASLTKDSNVVLLNPLPFQMIYIIELYGDVFVEQVLADKDAFGITISAYIEGSWVVFDKKDTQTFIVNSKVRYLRILCKEDCSRTYLLIE